MKKGVAILTFVLLSLSAKAQDPDYQTYAKAAGENMPLFRARMADNYGTHFNGTPMVDTLGFLKGSICFEGKTYTGLLFNLDASNQHVLMRREGAPIALDLGRERVSWFIRGERKFVNLPAQGLKLPEGFYELMAQGQGAVYRKTDKEWAHLMDMTSDARGFLGYEDPHYRSGLADYFKWKESWYWVKEDGTVQRLRGKRRIHNAIQAVTGNETH